MSNFDALLFVFTTIWWRNYMWPQKTNRHNVQIILYFRLVSFNRVRASLSENFWSWVRKSVWDLSLFRRIIQ